MLCFRVGSFITQERNCSYPHVHLVIKLLPALYLYPERNYKHKMFKLTDMLFWEYTLQFRIFQHFAKHLKILHHSDS
jgi:hypothetical protein